MSKARDLADFVSAGSPLADGTISVSEVSGAAPTASPTFTGDATFDTDTLVVDSTNNRVGIGTSSPIDKLTVGGSTDPRIAVRMTSGGTDNSARMIVQTNSTASSNGDAFITFDNNQTGTVGTTWMVGTDSSAAMFKIAAADLGNFNGTNEYLTINSSGTVTANAFVGDGSGLTGVGFTTNVITGNTTATVNNHYYLNGSAITLTLPASPSVGDEVRISEVAGNTDCVIGRNGSNIMGDASDLTIDTAYLVLSLRYVDATIGWAFS